MTTSNLADYEGPRSLLPEEWDEATSLRRSVFFPDGPDLPELMRRRPIGWRDECWRIPLPCSTEASP